MALIIDARERKLIKQFAADQISVETLDVCDIKTAGISRIFG